MLSVSGSYLALRGVYLALWAALPSNPTLGKSQRSRTAALQAYHPLRAMATVKLDFDWPSTPREDSPKRHISRDREGLRFGDGLFPFHSPLLRESLLFSFPPLINMLKFGPYSYLNSGRKMIGLYCGTYDSTCTTDTDCNPGHKIPRVESAELSQHNLELR